MCRYANEEERLEFEACCSACWNGFVLGYCSQADVQTWGTVVLECALFSGAVLHNAAATSRVILPVQSLVPLHCITLLLTPPCQ